MNIRVWIAISVLLLIANSMNAMIVRVIPTGSDANDGSSWSLAKKTIIGAVSAAHTGDEIWVASGDYSEKVSLTGGVSIYGGFAGTELIRSERNPSVNTSRIKPSSGSCITVATGAGLDTVIDGMSLSTAGSPGILCSNASPTISNNVVHGNGGGISLMNSAAVVVANAIGASATNGGGIYISGGSPTIKDNSFCFNFAENLGGCIYLLNTTAMIVHNRFCSTGNRLYATKGGVIYSNTSAAMILANYFQSNIADSGAAIEYGGSAALVIANNIMIGNGAFSGGAIINGLGSNAKIVNNTIVSNYSATGGVINIGTNSATIANNVIAYNSAGVDYKSKSAKFFTNDVFGNFLYNYSGLGDPTGTNGNISVDPGFALEAYGNLHLQPASSCVDTGDDSSVDLSWQDMDGQSRIFGSHVDIGADESDGIVWPTEPTVVFVSPAGADTNDGSSWASAKKTIQAGIELALSNFGEVWVAEGQYSETVTARCFTHLYAGFAGTESNRVDRDPKNHVCIIAEGTLNIDPSGSEDVIDGFDVRPMKYNDRGAINALMTAATINGCTIVSSGNSWQYGCLHGNLGSPTVTNCHFEGNPSVEVMLESCSAVLQNNTINGRSDISVDAVGLSCDGNSHVVIEDNLITNCKYGGVTVGEDVIATILRNRIADNGMGVICNGGASSILNNVIARNFGRDPGGGVVIGGDAVAQIANNLVFANKPGIALSSTLAGTKVVNNTIVGNIATNGAGLAFAGAQATIANNVIAHNTTGIELVEGGIAPIFSNNDVWQNGYTNFAGMPNPTGTNGNISADPQFANWQNQDYHLQAASPCVDAGAPAFVDGGWVDMDGQLRIQGLGPDIGADESDGTNWHGGPAVTFVKPDGNDLDDGLSWATAKRTIGSALMEASERDGEIWIAGGTFKENLVLRDIFSIYGGFKGNEVDRNDRDWKANPTIIDGSFAGLSIEVIAVSGVMDGLRVRNGTGGGIYCRSGSPTIQNCAIEWCSGSGIICNMASPVIARNILSNNVNPAKPGEGGGIEVTGLSAPTIVQNLIRGNSALNGGGVYVGGPATIANNWIVGNGSDGGGGLYLSSVSGGIIVGNTIAGNTATTGAGGIHYRQSTALFSNNVVAFNGGGGVLASGSAPASTFHSNDVFGNSGANWSGVTDPTGTDGNIAAEPLIASLPFGNFHLQPTSPCVDAGNNSDAMPGYGDYDGQSRILGPAVDIGADESDGTLWNTNPAIIHVRPDGDDSHDGLTWETAKKTIQAGLDLATDLGGEAWVMKGTYPEMIRLPVFVALYGGFAGSESDRSERNFETNPTIIDAEGRGTAVNVAAGEHLSVLDGFTIKRGNAGVFPGAGIYALYSSNEIANCVVRECTSQIKTGTAVVMQGAASRLISCKIIDNSIPGVTAKFRAGLIDSNLISRNQGTGLAYLDKAGGTIQNNTISYNNSTIAVAGVDLGSSTVLFARNVVAHNTSTTQSLPASALSSLRGTPRISGNIFAWNSSANGYTVLLDVTTNGQVANNVLIGNYEGSGAIGLYQATTCSVTNNTLISNHGAAQIGYPYVFAITNYGTNDTIANNLVAYNSGGIYAYSAGTYANNNVYANATNYSGTADPTGTSGNISVDPIIPGIWVGDYHLGHGSPCIDAGNNSYVFPGFADIDNENRISGAAVDIGADEWYEDHTVTLPSAVVRVDGGNGNDLNDGLSWASAKKTVQGGIDALPDGGEVWIRGGIYQEHPIASGLISIYGGFAGNESDRSKRDWVANPTTIDGGRSGQVLSLVNGVGYLDGFTIRNGVTGGLLIQNSIETMVNLVISDNKGARGCGLNVNDSLIRISYSAITNNSDVDGANGFNYGPNQLISTSGTFDHVVVQGNTSQGGSLGAVGAGISFVNGGYLICTNCKLVDNVADSGPAIYCVPGAGLTLINSVASGNRARAGGGALYLSGNATLIGNTIVLNSAPRGAVAFSGTNLTMANNLISHNASGVYLDKVALLDFHNNDVFDNGWANLSGFASDPIGVDGNISEDPLIANRYTKDVHIQPGSPCIDGGSDVDSSGSDIDDEVRLLGAHVDIGADESDGTVWVGPSPSKTIYVKPLGSDAADGLRWQTAKRTVAAALAISAPGDEVWVTAGTYKENLTLPSSVKLYGGFLGTEWELEDRFLSSQNQSILDGAGGSTKSIIDVSPGALPDTVIDGFTITKGSRQGVGAGINVSGASPTISRNVFVSNGGIPVYLYSSGSKVSSLYFINNGSVGLYSRLSNIAVHDSLFYGNRGGASFSVCHGEFINCTVAKNPWTYGLVLSSSPLFLANNVIAFNNQGVQDSNSIPPANWWNSVIYGNGTKDYDPSIKSPVGKNGNVSVDPLFIDIANGDYHLSAASTCIDTGLDDATVPPRWDVDLLPRTIGHHVDVGASEYVSTTATGIILLNDFVGIPPDRIRFELRELGSRAAFGDFDAVIRPNGEFAIPVPAAALDLAAKPGHWLRRVVPIDATNGSVSGIEITLENGDAERNNVVNIRDLNAIFLSFGEGPSPNDLDGGGSVDMHDLTIVVMNFGMAGDD